MIPYCIVLYCTVLRVSFEIEMVVNQGITMYYYVSGSDGGFALSICYFQAAVKARKQQAPLPKAVEGPVMSRKVSCSGVAP